MPETRENVHHFGKMTVQAEYEEALRHFLMDCKFRNLSPETIRSYRIHLTNLHQDMEVWNATLCTLTAKDLSQRMVNGMIDRGQSIASINNRIRSCKVFQFNIRVLRSYGNM